MQTNPNNDDEPVRALHLGASWYPEMWPEEEWPKDIARMKEVGFTLVRLFEFAWKRFEPSEGCDEFDWALRVLDQLHAAGIRAMIGTPTAAPPAWLTSRYPEVLLTEASGKRQTHGQRKHYNPHSKKYRELSRGIVARMVERLGSHPAVHSWQIDNEMSGFDYGEETHRHFHAWLEAKYGTIENLNATWGLNFWSQAYDEFSQVPLCTASVGSVEVPERHHPSLIMAIARFQNDGWAAFMQDQVETIQAGCSHPVTSNMTGFIGAMDWDSHFKLMDRAGISCYADLDHVAHNSCKMERLRPMKAAPYWVLETAPNWSGGGPIWNIHHNADGVRVFSWLSILLGGSMVLYWQWRSHWAGQEMQHGTCVSATGQWMPGKATWKKLADEFDRHGEWLEENPAARGPIAIMTDCRSSWLFSIDPIDPGNRYDKRVREDYYLPLRDAHYARDIIHPDTPLEDYKVILCPHLPILSEQTRQRLRSWVEAGGRLMLGPLTGTRTDEMTAWTSQTFGGLEALMGAEGSIRFTPHWVEESITVRFTGGGQCHPRIWCEGFAAGEGTEVLARYEGGYGDGHAAVVSRVLGEGRVISVGCPLDENCLMSLVRELAEEVGVKPLIDAPAGVMACPRVNSAGDLSGIGLVNTKKETQTVGLPAKGLNLLKNQSVEQTCTLEPLEVALVQF
ncbi:MAG: beta-galactosidase [Opitutales bacterium]